MSRAFVKETDAVEDLPDRLISPHPNLVTGVGLEQIEAEVERLSRAYADAQAATDRDGLAAIARDLRYWSARRASAQLVPVVADAQDVRFGSRVVIARPDGRRQTYRIVGEDEAEPSQGTLSWVSPLAQSLMGKVEGDPGRAGAADYEVIEVVQA